MLARITREVGQSRQIEQVGKRVGDTDVLQTTGEHVDLG